MSFPIVNLLLRLTFCLKTAGVFPPPARRDGSAAGPSILHLSPRFAFSLSLPDDELSSRDRFHCPTAAVRHHGSDEIAACHRVGAGATAATEGGDGHGHQQNDNRDSQSFFAHFSSPFSDAFPVQECGAQGMDGDRTLGGENLFLPAQSHPLEGGNISTIPIDGSGRS